MVNQGRKARVAQLAARQFGMVAWWQLLHPLGIDRKTVHRWRVEGYLHRVLPTVYAVGHRAQGTEGDLVGAVLYAGPGAALSHSTAAWWLGLIDDTPRHIHVATPRQCRSLPRIKVHGKRIVDRAFHRAVPVTILPQILLDLAATSHLGTLRRALAAADYKELLDLEAVEAALKPGRPGAAPLRAALQAHQPTLALTKSELERALLELCEQEGLSLPEVNVRVDGWEVDALWRADQLAVELDGYRNHHTRAQLARDRRKEMALRQSGLTPVRYSAEQLTRSPHEVVSELRRLTST